MCWNTTTMNHDPFNPADHPGAPVIPERRMTFGAGDLVHLAAKPIATLIDKAFHTDLKNCPGCAKRRADWNKKSTDLMRRITPRNGMSPRPSSPPQPHVSLPPKHWKRYESAFERAIVIPWLSSAATWVELKYALRSIEKHWTDRTCPIVIVCDRAPAWLKSHDRIHIHVIPEYSQGAETGYWEAIQYMFQVAGRIAWWNDDIYLLKDTGWDDIATVLTEGDLTDSEDSLRSSGNSWRRNMGDMVAELKKRGHDTVTSYATHTPYYFEAEKSRVILDSYHIAYKGCWEGYYFNHFPPENQEPSGRHKTLSLPSAHDARYLNHKHSGPDESTKKELARLFGTPAPWEQDQNKPAPIIVSDRIPRIVSMASFPPRLAGMRRVVADLLPQCDAMRLYLNGYDTRPDIPNDPKITVILAGPQSEHPDLGSHGKWHWLGREDCHHLTVDDDIIYPSDYVSGMVAACERFNDKAIVSAHGWRFREIHAGRIPQQISVLRNREMFGYHHMHDDTPVHVLGSGLMCLRASRIGLSNSDVHGALHSGDDEDLAIWAQKHSVPMVRIATGAGWAIPNGEVYKLQALHRSPDFRKASDKKLRSYKSWTIHKP